MQSGSNPNQNNNKNDFDDFPIYDEVIRRDTNKLSGIWRDFFAMFKENLSSYLTSGGIFLPNLTQTQIENLESPINGQTVYNVTNQTAQYYSNGSWVPYP